MRLYYVDEREGEGCFVRSALGVEAERWNGFFQDVRAWRMELRDRYGIRPADRAATLRLARAEGG